MLTSTTLRQVLAWIAGSLALALVISFVARQVLGHPLQRTLFTDVIQGIPVGGLLAYLTASLIIHAEVRSLQTTVNGWSTTLACGAARKDIGLLRRAACASDVSALNVPEEQMYWQAFVDGAGRKLDGRHAYRLTFPPGGLPPNDASWSLTVADSGRRMVDNPIHRYSAGGRSGLVPNADGSVDIYLQSTAPAGHEANWLPVPAGTFMLWLRVYQPGTAILAGAYHVPPVVQAT
ncbi:MAG: DUF1214 domain-containing protein [Myxococcales bacterium]